MGEELLMSLLIAIIPTAVSAVILSRINAMNKRSDNMEERRKEEGVLLLKSLDAIGNLSEMTALCYKGIKPNGELDRAIAERQKVKQELRNHLYTVHEELKGAKR